MQKDFSYPLKVEDISASESKYHIKADKGELEFLTDLMKVPKVHNLEVDFRLKLERKKHLLNVKGSLKASVELTSVISLENFIENYNESFSLVFDTNPEEICELEQEFGVDDEIIDHVENGEIDLGQLAEEQLALLIDDYPKKKGETFAYESEWAEEKKKNPFDVLAKLKK